MEDRLQKKKNHLDFYFSSFQDIFSGPYSSSKCTPYSNVRVSSEQKYYADFLIEKKNSEKNLLAEFFDEDNDQSLSSSDSKNQLPYLKHKKVKKVIGLPYQQEIKKNENLIKMKKIHTASNWFPGVNAPVKCEEVRSSQQIVRPASSSGPCKRSSIKINPVVALSSNDLKSEPPNSNRPRSKHKRVVLKNKIKTITEETEKIEKAEQLPEKVESEQDEMQEKKETLRKKNFKGSISKKLSACKDSQIAEIEEVQRKPKEDKKNKKKEDKKAEKMKAKEKVADKKGKIQKKESEEFEIKQVKSEKNEKKRKVLPPSVSEIVDKRRCFNLNQLLNNKNTDFKGLMQEYLRRSGLPENSKIFIISGPYEYLRKILISRGWLENTHLTSQAFDLKWTNNDNESDYKSLRTGQLYNHFSNNRELTTKFGLHKNLRQVMDYGTNIDEFFPRTYDLGDSTQVLEFTKDYYRTCAFNLIKKSVEGIKVKSEILEIAVKIAEKYVKDVLDQCEEIESEWEYSEDLHKKILEYCEQDGFESVEERKSVSHLEALNEKISKLFPQHYMEGHKNIWIVKPGLNARGSGVKCMQGLSNILECGVHLQARVVQKYVEIPLLINSNKFDIRQWVLVTSFDPLTIYFFNNCYLRLCQMSFTLDSLEAHRHLANYSLQKNVAKNQEDTVWSLSKFCDYLKSIGKHWGEILPKIHYMVIKTLLSVKDSIESRPECFELYGFDIILDNQFAPWLLEVNLSPACTERTEWLSEMLTKMGSGIVDILFGDTHKQPLYSSNLKLVKNLKSNKNKWVFLYKAEEFPVNECENLTYAPLEIVGEKLNFKRERIFDRRLALSKSALIIQKVYRGHLTRKRIKKEKDEKLAELIQKWFRRKIAFGKLDFQIRLVSCIKIQSFVRMNLAVKLGKFLKKMKMIRFVQAHVKGFYQRWEFKQVKLKRSSIIIQKKFRSFLAKAAVKREHFVRASVILIQKNWVNRFRLKNKASVTIQKFWRLKLKRLNQFAVKIQKQLRGFKARKMCKSLKILQLKAIKLQGYLRMIQCKKILFSKKATSASKYIFARSFQNTVLKLLTFSHHSKSAINIQKHYRRLRIQRKYRPLITENLKIRISVQLIQKHIQGLLSRQTFELLLKNKSATLIQKFFKGFKARKFFNFLIILHESAKIIQRNYRQFKARRKFQMFLRIRVQENERRKRMERLRREQEIKALLASERLHTNSSVLRPPSLKAKQCLILETKMAKIKRKGSKKKCKPEKMENSCEEIKTLPRASTQEGKKLKKVSPKETSGIL